MRQVGAQSLRVICELDLVELGPDAAGRAVSGPTRRAIGRSPWGIADGAA